MTAVTDPRVKAYIQETVGVEGMRLVEILDRKGAATDSQLAEELGAKPSHIRKILYDLYEARVAEYKKEKDKETGWLTFYWNLNANQASYALEQKRKKELNELSLRLVAENANDWFICPQGEERFDFAGATEHNFSCPEHHAVLQAHDNAQVIRDIQARIAVLRAAAENGEA